MTTVLPSKQFFANYGQFHTMYTSGQRTITLGGAGRTGLGPVAMSLTWSTPAAARTLTIPDPLGDDTFVFAAMTQTLTNKTISGAILTGVVSLDNGTAAAPSLTFASDTDTGLYRIGANNIGLSVGGTGSGLNLSATALSPTTTDGEALGTTALQWSDIFLATGAVVNFNNGGVTLTHSSKALALSGSAVASVGTSPGTDAGTLWTISGITGGATSIATTGTGGSGSGVTISTGAGGQATAAATAATGGNGGTLTLASGAGAIAGVAGAGNATGGTGGTIAVTAGNGGAVGTSTGTNAGGPGGAITITTGTGGAAAATAGTDNGGAGGLLSLIAGAGGNGAETGGAGGGVAITAGNAGTGGNVNGGVVTITAGTAQGTGAPGVITMASAMTSGLPTGLPATSNLGTHVTSATPATGSTDQRGRITIVGDGSAWAAGVTVCSVAFNNARRWQGAAMTTPVVILMNSTAGANDATHFAGVYQVANVSATGFDIVANIANNAGAFTGTVDYWVIG